MRDADLISGHGTALAFENGAGACISYSLEELTCIKRAAVGFASWGLFGMDCRPVSVEGVFV
ncbi:MAG: hypothetical protein OXN84_06860 [Albidovulum sp.]|nr:hypothetical protein [Albidovulum sp.]